MARFTADDADRYGGQGGSGYFRLVNDMDVARVRFLYGGIEDVEGYAVHQVTTGMKDNGKPIKKYVNCLREYNEPKDVCPFCREGKPQYAKLFIPLYNLDSDKVEIWDRGKKFFPRISGLCSRYPNLVSHTFDIERHGKAGEQTTTYEIYPVASDDTTLEQFDIPEIMGGTVLDKTADDMEYYLQEGQFPPEEGEQQEEMPVRRSSSRRDTETEQEAPRRRTPANRRESF